MEAERDPDLSAVEAEGLLATALAAFRDPDDLPPLATLVRWASLPSIRMPRAAFERLPEYSVTDPTNARPGKMWRANLANERRLTELAPTWWDVPLWVVRTYQRVPGRADIVRNVQWRYDSQETT